MIVSSIPERTTGFSMRGTLGFGRGYGGSEYGKARYGFSTPTSGIYQRKLIAKGADISNPRAEGRWGVSRMRFYRPTNTQQPAQQAWRSIFADGWPVYNALTIEQKKRLSKEAAQQGLTGPNLFMSRWLQSRRG